MPAGDAHLLEMPIGHDFAAPEITGDFPAAGSWTVGRRRELRTAGFLWIGSGMEEIDQRQKNVCPPGEPGQSGQDEHILVAHGDLREQFRLPSNQRAAVRVSIAQSNILQRGNILPNPLRPRHRCRPPLAIEIIGAGAAATSEILVAFRTVAKGAIWPPRYLSCPRLHRRNVTPPID